MHISCHSQFLKYDELAMVLQILSQRQELTKEGCILEAAIEAGAKELIGLKDSLNDWDSKVGDGDCGTTVGLVGVYQVST